MTNITIAIALQGQGISLPHGKEQALLASGLPQAQSHYL